MTLWQKFALYQEWLPLINIGQKLLTSPGAHAKAVVVSEAFEWVSAKTDTQIDDKYAPLVADLVETPQFKAIVDAIEADITAAKEAMK